MTMQIPNWVIYKDHRYDLIALKGAKLPTPEDFGITPGGMLTSCWRGYYKDYTVIDNQLVLVYMVVASQDETYLPRGAVKEILRRMGCD